MVDPFPSPHQAQALLSVSRLHLALGSGDATATALEGLQLSRGNEPRHRPLRVELLLLLVELTVVEPLEELMGPDFWM